MGSLSGFSPHAATIDPGQAATLGSQGFTPVPQLVQWLVTARCPLTCAHCLAAGPTGPELSVGRALDLIDQVAALGVPDLLLTGGEPLARADFPALVDRLAERGQAWSLNTAVMPGPNARAAMQRHPPRFVAISLDGPEEIHDTFRGRPGTFAGAMDAVGYYAGLVPGGVCVGTTVTTFNLDHLPATFGLVLGSGASSWGLHLLVPEGRAAKRPDLNLSVAQQRWLLAFAAEKRQHFAVSVADEIGFCGPFEPLVRDQPFFCGAGRSGCVVLPDGEVVPCTTLDRSTSAGTLTRRTLAWIWKTGFADLRKRTPEGKCRTCEAAQVCGGGCWLRRRRDQACAKPIWRLPRVAAVASLAAVLGAGPQAEGQPPAPGQPAKAGQQDEWERMQLLQRSIIEWYAGHLGSHRSPDVDQVLARIRKDLPRDPAATYFLDYTADRLPGTLSGIAARLGPALSKTQQRSLCFVGLVWRDLVEWSLAGPALAARPAAERRLLAATLKDLAQTARAWRVEIFARKLDPFLRRPLDYRRFMISKAGPTTLQRLESQVARSRGYIGLDHQLRDLAAEFLQVSEHGQGMALAFDPGADRPRLRVRRGAARVVDGCELMPFDLLEVDAREPTPVVLTIEVHGQPVEVALPPGAQLWYGDLLRLADDQNRDLLARLAAVDRCVPKRHPLLLPALLRQERALASKPEAGRDPHLYRVRWALADLLLF